MKNKRWLSLLVAMMCLVGLIAGTLSGCGSSKIQVKFDWNYDEAPEAPAPIEVKTGKAYRSIPEVTLTREGYDFAGWYLNAKGDGEPVTSDTVVTKEKAHTLYAKWEGHKFTVSFDLQGGNINGVSTVEPATVTLGNVYSMMAIPDDPQRDGHTFLGWYYDAEGTKGPVTASTQVVTVGDHTLYAKWKENQLLYNFENPDDVSAFTDRGFGLSYMVTPYGESNQLMVQNTNEGLSEAYFVMWADLKAGTRVTMDISFEGSLPTAEDRMFIFCYGSNPAGDPYTTGLVNKTLSETHRKWYDGNGYRAMQSDGQWYIGDEDDWKSGNAGTIDFVVMEDCYGITMWISFGKDLEFEQRAENTIYIDNIQFTPGYMELTEDDYGAEPEQEVTDGEENFPFTFECGSLDSDVFKKRDSNLNLSVTEKNGSQQLLVQPSRANGKYYLWMNKELKAGTMVTMDVTFAGELPEGSRMHLFCYGSNSVGDPMTTGAVDKTISDNHRKWYDGNGHKAMQSGGVWYYGDENDWKAGNTVKISVLVMENCSGLSIWMNFGNNLSKEQVLANAIYIDNIKAIPNYKDPNTDTSKGETQFPFDFECGSYDAGVFRKRDSKLELSVEKKNESSALKIQPTANTNMYWLWMNMNLKAGTLITMDVTFDGKLAEGDRMYIFSYGSTKVGDPITSGTIDKSISDTHRKWYDGNGHKAMQSDGVWYYGDEGDWKEGSTVTVEMIVMEDCSGLSMMLNFAGSTKNAIYIDNITATEGYLEVGDGDHTGTVTPPQEETEGEEDFPFTFNCGSVDSDVFKIRDSKLALSVENEALQVKPTAKSNMYWLWLNRELKAGSRISVDVTFDGELSEGERMYIFSYGSTAVGDPITSGSIDKTLSEAHRKWYDGNGSKAMQSGGVWYHGDENDWTEGATVTVEMQIMEDCHGLSMMLNFAGNLENAIYLDNIQIVENEPEEPTEPQPTEPNAETNFPFTFDCGSVSADLFKIRDSKLALSVTEYEGSQKLKIQPTAASDMYWLWLNRELKAGTQITMDVTFAGTLSENDRMYIFSYGSTAVGDPITSGSIDKTLSESHRKWYDGNGSKGMQADGVWYHGDENDWTSGATVTVEMLIMEDCHGISMMLNFAGNLQNAIYLDNIQIVENEPEEPTEPSVPAAAETDFPFTFEGGLVSEEIFKPADETLSMEIVEQDGSKQLKLQSSVAGSYYLWINKPLTAGTVITMDVTFQRKLGAMSLFCFGAQADGTPITNGTVTEAVPQTWFSGQGGSADFSGGTPATQTVTFTVYEDCSGISLLLGFGKAANVIYLDNIKVAGGEKPMTYEMGVLTSHWAGINKNGDNITGIYATGVVGTGAAYNTDWSYEYTPAAAENFQLIRDGVTYYIGCPSQGTLVMHDDGWLYLKAENHTVADSSLLPLQIGDVLVLEGNFTCNQDALSTIHIEKTYILITENGAEFSAEKPE